MCVRTGWAEARYHSAAEYLNAADPNDIDAAHGKPRMAFPGLTKEAAEAIVARGAVGVGIDTLSPDGGACSDGAWSVHHAILGSDRYILENLKLVGGLPARGAHAFVAPLNVVGAPEAPIRLYVIEGAK